MACNAPCLAPHRIGICVLFFFRSELYFSFLTGGTTFGSLVPAHIGKEGTPGIGERQRDAQEPSAVAASLPHVGMHLAVCDSFGV